MGPKMMRHERGRIRSAGKCFPDFFVIGAPKCGTTSLFSWLQAHPETYLPVKESNFFSQDVLDTRREAGAISDFDEYLSRLCPEEATGKMTGEATPKYLYSDQAFEVLSRHAGAIRLIVLLRNPVDLVLAMHGQNLRTGREPEADFVRAWARGPAKPGDLLTDYRYWGRPGARIERYVERFPRADLKMLILEEAMSRDPAAAHADVLEFLGLPPQVLPGYARVNAARAYRWAWLQGNSRRFRRAVLRGAARLGITPPPTGLIGLVNRINGNRPGARHANAEVRAAIAAELSSDTKRVARLLGGGALPWPDFD